MTEVDYDKIDNYLSGKLSPAERIVFETEMQANPDLQAEVQLYASIDQQLLLKGTLDSLNAAHFRQAGKDQAKVVQLPKRRMYRIIASVAAIFIIAIGIYFVAFQKQSVSQLADNYVQEQMAYISPAMAGAADSLQSGIKAFNEKRYEDAERIFRDMSSRDRANISAKENLGKTYLMEKEYDRAINEFRELSRIELVDNPGFFLQAVALLSRDKPGDKQQAKSLLQIVVANNYEGSPKAKEWLDKW